MRDRIKIMRDEMEKTLHDNILHFWLSNMQDDEHGGFYGQMTGDGTLVKNANKGGILNARILWSFSAAYRVTGREEYLKAAERARDYIVSHFLDKEYGGTYWELDYLGKPIDKKKQFYAIGFMIYGLSEFVRATFSDATNKDKWRETLDLSLTLYRCIEEHSLDKEYNGYIEAMTYDWQQINDMRLSELDANYPKSQNTHLHIMEPYANLLRCMKEMREQGALDADKSRDMEDVTSSLRNIIWIFTEKILNKDTNHLDLFFEYDWTRGAGQLESYGHDIECSWLIHEAALVLNDKELLRNVEQKVRLIAKASEKGINKDGSMLHEANLDTGYVDTDRHWWVQAENVVGWFNIYQHFNDEQALERAERCWQYIKDNLIDEERGEWYWSADTEGRKNTKDDHAGFWKCPYHNSRMCLEIIERTK